MTCQNQVEMGFKWISLTSSLPAWRRDAGLRKSGPGGRERPSWARCSRYPFVSAAWLMDRAER